MSNPASSLQLALYKYVIDTATNLHFLYGECDQLVQDQGHLGAFVLIGVFTEPAHTT